MVVVVVVVVVVSFIPTNTGAAHLDSDLARLQAFSCLDILDRGLRLCEPEVMVGVGEDANVGLVDGGGGSHSSGRG